MQCKHWWKFKNLHWSQRKKKLKQLIHLTNTWGESCPGDRKASKDLAALAFGCNSYLTETQMTQLESDGTAARKLCSSRDQLHPWDWGNRETDICLKSTLLLKRRGTRNPLLCSLILWIIEKYLFYLKFCESLIFLLFVFKFNIYLKCWW